MSAIFFARLLPLIAFSQAMASSIRENSALETSLVVRYFAENPSKACVLCCQTRCSRLLVTPVYSVRDVLAMMYT